MAVKINYLYGKKGIPQGEILEEFRFFITEDKKEKQIAFPWAKDLGGNLNNVNEKGELTGIYVETSKILPLSYISRE